MKIVTMYRMRLILIILLLILCNSALVFGSDVPMKDALQITGVMEEHSVEYPSLIPRYYLSIKYNYPLDKVKAEDVSQYLTDPGKWKITVNRKGEKDPIILDRAEIQKIDLLNPINLRMDVRLTPGALRKGDEITEIKIGDITYSTPVAILESVPKWAFSIDPKMAPNEELTTGEKKSATQAGIKLDIPQLTVVSDFAHVFLSSDNLLSSESKDKNSKLEFKIGAERSLLNTYYSPASINAEFIANQPFSNASIVTSASTKWLLPWGWTAPILWNHFIKAPISPLITFAAQYENRLKQDPLTDSSHAKDNLFRINGEFDWSPIYLLNKEDNLVGKDGALLSGMKLEFTAKGWYFPDERATGGASVRRFEGNVTTALYISMPKWITEEKGAMIKIAYITGANEANGFARSSSLTLGVEYFQK